MLRNTVQNGLNLAISGARWLVALVAITIMVNATAGAQNITPSHVYQVVDDVNSELALLHNANGSKAKTDKKAPDLTARKPRHVFQKAKEVLQKVQTLRKLNGLSVNEIPAFPVAAIKPADVKDLVVVILKDVRGLRATFGVSEASPTSSLQSSKTPTDVYGNLIRASLQLDGLGIPRIVPNDVYQVAMTIISDINKIRTVLGQTDEFEMMSGSKGKKPKAVYQRSFDLLNTLKTKSNNDKFKVPGGVILPNKRSGKIRPGHVMDVLNNALAEIGAIKVTVGATIPTEIAPVPSGKTPSNVFDAVSTALAMAEKL